MGNNQGMGLQICTTSHDDLLTERFMVDKDFRIDYRNTEILPRKKHGRVQHQQRVLDVTHQLQEPEDVTKAQIPKPKVQIVKDEKHIPPEEKVFKGLFGDVTLQIDGFVEYVDSTGKKHREAFKRKEIRKTFPLGISLGGLTKSLWFKDAWERDICFEYMSATPAGAAAEAETSDCEETEDSCNYKVFVGIKGNKVFVYPDNHVVYTDVEGETHNVSYKPSKIQKCFPNGICFGGLPRTIWLDGALEMYRCFRLMKEGESQPLEEDCCREFTGLYGSVTLKPEYEIEFTSLTGEVVTCTYNPRCIRKVYPMGITSNTLPTTIWFEETKDCDSCFSAMKETC